MSAADRYLASFPAGAVVEFPVVGLDVLDAPLHSAALCSGTSSTSSPRTGNSTTAPGGNEAR